MTEIVQQIVAVEYRRIKSGAGAILKMACGHERWVGGYPNPSPQIFRRCLGCEAGARP